MKPLFPSYPREYTIIHSSATQLQLHRQIPDSNFPIPEPKSIITNLHIGNKTITPHNPHPIPSVILRHPYYHHSLKPLLLPTMRMRMRTTNLPYQLYSKFLHRTTPSSSISSSSASFFLVVILVVGFVIVMLLIIIEFFLFSRIEAASRTSM